MTSTNPQTKRPLSLIAATDKGNLGSDDPVLVLVDILVVDRVTGVETGEAIRIVNMAKSVSSDEDDVGGVHMTDPISFASNYYQPASFDVKLKEAAGEVPQVTLTMHDVTGIVRTYMDLYAGGVGFNVRVSVVWQSVLSLPAAQQKPEIAETFQVTLSSIADRDVTLTLGAPSLLTIQFPRRRQTKDFCQWQYKGAECQYSGTMDSCSRTLKGNLGCEAHNNVNNFGGFPGITPRSYLR